MVAATAPLIRRWGPALALALLVAAAFSPVLSSGFINLDDPAYVSENPALAGGVTGRSLLWAATAFDAANWHPVTWLSHLIDVELFGLDPAGHHATSLFLHVATVVLLYAALLAMTGAPAPSFLAAALFGLHPLRVESVAWVAERKDLLAGLFLMLTLLAYIAWSRRPSPIRYLGVTGAFALGLAAKPSLVPLPLLLLLLDYWPLRRKETPWRLVLEKIPLTLLAVASSLITLLAQGAGGAIGGAEAFPFGLRLANAVVSYGRYLGKILFPSHLAPFYPYPASVPRWQVALALLLLAGITVAVLRVRRERPPLVVGWLWFLIAFIPVIGLVPVGSQAMADRYTYLPSVGFALAVVWGLAMMAPLRKRWFRLLLPAAVLIALVAATFSQSRHWRGSEPLFSHALRVTEGNQVAAFCLGEALETKGDLEGAAKNYRLALLYDSRYFKARNNLAMILAAQGRHAEAIGEYVTALQTAPPTAEIWNNLGISYAADGRFPEARRAYLTAISLKPAYAYPRMNLAVLCLRVGDPECVAEQHAALQRLDPQLAAALASLPGFAR